MKKIIINPHNYNAVEVSLNGRFAPYMGMNQLSYRQLLIKENEALQKLSSIALKAKLPEVANVPEAKQEQIAETLKVLRKVIDLMKAGFRVAIIFDILKITIGKASGFGTEFQRRFEPLFQDAECREDFWGTKESAPFLITMGLLDSLMN